MALSTAAAMMQWIETMGLGVPVSNRFSATPAKRPYITVMDDQPTAPGPAGRRTEDGGPGTAIETVIVDIWQDYKSRNNAGAMSENPSLAAQLIHNIQGGRPVDGSGKPIIVGGVPGGAGVIYRCFVRANHKLSDPSVENLVHNSITLEVWRQF